MKTVCNIFKTIGAVVFYCIATPIVCVIEAYHSLKNKKDDEY